MKQRTYIRYSEIVFEHIIPHLGEYNIEEIILIVGDWERTYFNFSLNFLIGDDKFIRYTSAKEQQDALRISGR